MSEKQSSYRSIFKATSLFGGVQLFQIIIQIIKSKIIAILLGPAGVGVIGLYQSGLQLVQQITNVGLSSSAVRDVSEANGTSDIIRISKTVMVVRRLVWITGLLGLLVMALVSPLLSRTSFGNYDYTFPFIILSVTLLFDQLSAGQKVVLQGLRHLKDLARCSAIGVTAGLLISIPFYYRMRIKGIVPTLLLTSVCSLLVSWWYSRKIKMCKVELTYKDTFAHGRQMLVMGIAMSISGILSTGGAYITRSYIQYIGGIEEVGLYQAGFVIMTTYVGLVMNAIATDYYPRLSSINKDNEKCRETVCQQGEIGVMILAPLLTVCLAFMPIVLRILYSEEFFAANQFISWACLGMLLRFASWIISFLFVAKAESKLFILNEIAANVYAIVFNILGYKHWGLSGIGIAFTLSYSFYFLQVYFIAKQRYNFYFSTSFVKCFLIQLLLVVVSLVVALLINDVLQYVLGLLIILVSIIISLRELNQRIGICSFINNMKESKQSKIGY